MIQFSVLTRCSRPAGLLFALVNLRRLCKRAALSTDECTLIDVWVQSTHHNEPGLKLTFRNVQNHRNSIQDYLYSAFHETIVAKQLYRKLRFYNKCVYCRNLIYVTYGKIWLSQYNRWGLASSEVLRGVVIISSQVFGHLRSFKCWIQTEACVIPTETEKQVET